MSGGGGITAATAATCAATAWYSIVARRAAGPGVQDPVRSTERPLAGLALFTCTAVWIDLFGAEIGIAIALSIFMAAGALCTLIAPLSDKVLKALPAAALAVAVLAALIGAP
ncbi:MAG: hypothetical protein AAF899_13635 [Pseudomonadota bacterium]